MVSNTTVAVRHYKLLEAYTRSRVDRFLQSYKNAGSRVMVTEQAHNSKWMVYYMLYYCYCYMLYYIHIYIIIWCKRGIVAELYALHEKLSCWLPDINTNANICLFQVICLKSKSRVMWFSVADLFSPLFTTGQALLAVRIVYKSTI